MWQNQHYNEVLWCCRDVLRLQILFSSCEKTSLFGTNPEKCHTIVISIFLFRMMWWKNDQAHSICQNSLQSDLLTISCSSTSPPCLLYDEFPNVIDFCTHFYICFLVCALNKARSFQPHANIHSQSTMPTFFLFSRYNVCNPRPPNHFGVFHFTANY